MPQYDDPAADSWHVDKRIPVALIAALVLQFAGGVWFASSAYERLNSAELRITVLEKQASTVPERLARIEVLLERIERAQRETPSR